MDITARKAQEQHGPLSTAIESFREDGIKALNQSSSFNLTAKQDQSRGLKIGTTLGSFTTETTPGLEDQSHLLNGLGILALVISAGIIIAIIAVVISKMRKKRNMKEADEHDTEKRKNRSNSIDPYLQAIIFPTEPKPEWKNNLVQSLKNAGKRMSGKQESTRATIPDHLRHQLKHIYVY